MGKQRRNRSARPSNKSPTPTDIPAAFTEHRERTPSHRDHIEEDAQSDASAATAYGNVGWVAALLLTSAFCFGSLDEHVANLIDYQNAAQNCIWLSKESFLQHLVAEVLGVVLLAFLEMLRVGAIPLGVILAPTFPILGKLDKISSALAQAALTLIVITEVFIAILAATLIVFKDPLLRVAMAIFLTIVASIYAFCYIKKLDFPHADSEQVSSKKHYKKRPRFWIRGIFLCALFVGCAVFIRHQPLFSKEDVDQKGKCRLEGAKDKHATSPPRMTVTAERRRFCLTCQVK